MSRYTNMCQLYCHINNKDVQTALTLARDVAHIQMQPMFRVLCEWTMHIIMHSIIVFKYLIAHLILCLQYCVMIMLQPILIPALFDHKKLEQVISTNLQLSFLHYPSFRQLAMMVSSQKKIILFIFQCTYQT